MHNPPTQFVAWVWYLAGAFIMLILKCVKSVAFEQGKGINTWVSLKSWFLENSRDNITSWATTVGVVWIIGALYIQRVNWSMIDFFNIVPVDESLAFFLGAVMEIIAPNVAKYLISKISAGLGV